MFCIAAPLTLLFAAVLYHYVEKPGMSFGTAMAERLGNRKMANISGPAVIPSLLSEEKTL